MQTMPSFVYLIPAIFFFGIGGSARPNEVHRTERRTLSQIREHQPLQEAAARCRRLEWQTGQIAAS
jgi:hypothetical protein